MPRKYNARNKKPGWSDDDMRRALELIGNGQSVRSTARQTGIPLTTLHDHKSGKIEIGARRGRQPALPRDVEEEIISKTIKAAKSGFGISRFQLQHKAGRVAKALKLSTPFLKDNRGNMVAGRVSLSCLTCLLSYFT
ncbi:unnamed protein product [Owenia fusiformis]|uniref:HTH psq-type domain-containing protein n=1 Tax=Owenia fusiformis TaxID=6347 RepID=A0A8S4PX34_OWEFU|nr:unnamed protein product [Owenia fusiformis]